MASDRPSGAETLRADLALVQAGLFDSRAKAREAIEAGLVTANGQVVSKPASPVSSSAQLAATPAYPWVSRAGVKLEAGLDHFGFRPADCFCLDVGASTGGFTQVLLGRGAKHVLAVDVGHGQLHASLQNDPRVTLLEGQDARRLKPEQCDPAPSVLTCDVSFISLRLVLPHILPLVRQDAVLIALVKPQFEAGAARVKKGVVRDPAIYEEVCQTVRSCIEDLGWEICGIIPSPIEGQDGNREFLLGARHS